MNDFYKIKTIKLFRQPSAPLIGLIKCLSLDASKTIRSPLLTWTDTYMSGKTMSAPENVPKGTNKFLEQLWFLESRYGLYFLVLLSTYRQTKNTNHIWIQGITAIPTIWLSLLGRFQEEVSKGDLIIFKTRPTPVPSHNHPCFWLSAQCAVTPPPILLDFFYFQYFFTYYNATQI